jgi:hypothetical protein
VVIGSWAWSVRVATIAPVMLQAATVEARLMPIMKGRGFQSPPTKVTTQLNTEFLRVNVRDDQTPAT